MQPLSYMLVGDAVVRMNGSRRADAVRNGNGSEVKDSGTKEQLRHAQIEADRELFKTVLKLRHTRVDPTATIKVIETLLKDASKEVEYKADIHGKSLYPSAKKLIHEGQTPFEVLVEVVLPTWEDARDRARQGSASKQRIEKALQKLEETGDLIFPEKLNCYSGPKMRITSEETSTRKEKKTSNGAKDTKNYSSRPYSPPKAPSDYRFGSLLDDL